MSERQLIFSWAERGLVADVSAALSRAGVLPDAAGWRLFIDRLLLWSGAVALGAAAVFFIAHNWDALGRYAKFALVETAMLASVLAGWKLGLGRAAGKAALLTATLLLGALLALFGQTYQTGADTWQLFATWAALASPWVLVARFAALWVLWIALWNVAVVLYFTVFPQFLGFVFSTERQLWTLFVLDTGALVLWEVAARRIVWLRERWAPRVLACASGLAITLLVLHAVFDRQDALAAAIVVYAAWLGCTYYAYRYVTRDLFVLAGGSLSVIVAVTGALVRHNFDGPNVAGAFLLTALAVVAMAACAAWWLRHIAQEPGA